MVSLFRFLLVSLVFTLGTTTGGHAASFDCSKATTETELAICGDFQLSVDDRVIAYLFEKHMEWRKGRKTWWTGDGPAKTKPEIMGSQREWLKSTRDTCGDSSNCLRNSLDQRIDYLLDYVRLENPQSGTRYNANIFFKDNEKSGLRFLGGIVENLDSHNILPSLKLSEKTPFIIGTPVVSFYSSTQILWDESGESRNGHILAENDNPNMQLDFGEYSSVDYDKLNKCLKTRRIRDFRWLGDDLSLNTISRSHHGCITFIWNNGMGDEHGIFLPNINSEFVQINTEKYIQSTKENDFSEGTNLELFLTETGLVKRIYLKKFFKFINVSPDGFSDDILVSPNRKFILTDIYDKCSATLFDITNKTSVVNVSPEYGRNCYLIAGFSTDSSIWYLYDENGLEIYIYRVDGSFVGSYKVASNPYIIDVQFSENNNLITVHVDNGSPPVIMDISVDLSSQN